jgi:hypothetical protein
MRHKKSIMSQFQMTMATRIANDKVNSLLKRANEIENDSRKEERIKKQYCKSCFYQSGMAGQAFTNRECMCCGENQIYSSTSTDALCIDCAKEHNLCKHCGGDLEMRAGRRKWPEPKTKEGIKEQE